jgi:hypothetical protein
MLHAVSAKNRLQLSFKIAAIFLGSVIVVGGVLPSLSLPATALERCFAVGSVVSD